MPEISVVVPVYGNADTLEELHSRLTDALEGCSSSHEMIFVNDACPGDSGSVLARLESVDDRVRLLTHPVNRGQGWAVLSGLALARGESVVVMDADLQDAPEAIPLLLAELRRTDAGAVFAGRRGHYEESTRLLTSRIFKQLIAWTCAVPKDAGSFVVMSRRVVERLLGMRVRRPYILAMIGLTGSPTISIPVERSERPRGQSAYTAGMRLRMGLSGLATALSLKWRCR